MSSESHENIEEQLSSIVTKEYGKGNIVVATFERLQVMSMKEFIKQPAQGMLYDLNRDEATVLTFIKDPKWVNDFAVSKVIQELKKQLATSDDKIEHLTQIIEDFYINHKIQTLDNYINKPGKIKEITDIVYDENRKKK
jgi:hypothetical protein